jgi:hypothetical protein
MKIGLHHLLSVFIVIFSCTTLQTNVQAQAQSQAISSAETMYLGALHLISENRFDEAKNALIQILEIEPKHAGAWLDLAIVQCELGNKEEAERLFDLLITRFSPPTAIVDVINKQKAHGCSRRPLEKRVSFTYDRGVESNVNQGTFLNSFALGSGALQIESPVLPEYKPKPDRFNAASLQGFSGLNRFGLAGFAQAYWRKYDHLSTYDTVSLAAGLEQTWKTSIFTAQLTGFATQLFLDGRVYQKQEGAQLIATPTAQPFKRSQLSMIAGFTVMHYPALMNYDSHIGELRAQWLFDTNAVQGQMSIGYMTDSALAARQGGDRGGVLMNMTVRKRFTQQWIGELGWNRQIWQSKRSYSPGLIDQIRCQDTETFRVGIIMPINEQQNIRLDVRSVNNRENIPLLQYKNRLIQLSWQWKN